MTPILPADIQGPDHMQRLDHCLLPKYRGEDNSTHVFKSSFWLPYSQNGLEFQGVGRGQFRCYCRPQGRDSASWAWMVLGVGGCGGGGGGY